MRPCLTHDVASDHNQKELTKKNSIGKKMLVKAKQLSSSSTCATSSPNGCPGRSSSRDKAEDWTSGGVLLTKPEDPEGCSVVVICWYWLLHFVALACFCIKLSTAPAKWMSRCFADPFSHLFPKVCEWNSGSKIYINVHDFVDEIDMACMAVL